MYQDTAFNQIKIIPAPQSIRDIHKDKKQDETTNREERQEQDTRS
jgi:hypothetical protein